MPLSIIWFHLREGNPTSALLSFLGSCSSSNFNTLLSQFPFASKFGSAPLALFAVGSHTYHKILKRINPLKFLTSYFFPYDHDQTSFSALYSSAESSDTFECRYCILLIFTNHNSYLQWLTYNGCLINNRLKLNFKRCYSIILPAQS